MLSEKPRSATNLCMSERAKGPGQIPDGIDIVLDAAPSTAT